MATGVIYDFICLINSYIELLKEQDLKQKIIDFIIYYNKCMAKPCRWKSKCEKLIMSLRV